MYFFKFFPFHFVHSNLKVSQAIRHKLIKVPIQPVNKLLSRVGRSHSSQQLTNLEIDENEQLTFLKLFGTKFIEKNSAIPPVMLNSSADSSFPNELERRISLSGCYNEMDSQPTEGDDILSNKSFGETNKKPKMSKSNSTIGFSLRKHLLKFSREKEESHKANDKN